MTTTDTSTLIEAVEAMPEYQLDGTDLVHKYAVIDLIRQHSEGKPAVDDELRLLIGRWSAQHNIDMMSESGLDLIERLRPYLRTPQPAVEQQPLTLTEEERREAVELLDLLDSEVEGLQRRYRSTSGYIDPARGERMKEQLTKLRASLLEWLNRRSPVKQEVATGQSLEPLRWENRCPVHAPDFHTACPGCSEEPVNLKEWSLNMARKEEGDCIAGKQIDYPQVSEEVVEGLKRIMSACSDWRKLRGNKLGWDCDTPQSVITAHDEAQALLAAMQAAGE